LQNKKTESHAKSRAQLGENMPQDNHSSWLRRLCTDPQKYAALRVRETHE
jgi:hypothetical protein